MLSMHRIITIHWEDGKLKEREYEILKHPMSVWLRSSSGIFYDAYCIVLAGPTFSSAKIFHISFEDFPT